MAARTITVKNILFYRAHGTTVENNLDPEYQECLSINTDPDTWHPVKPDLLRYDLGFVREDDPTLVAFVKFSNGYGGEPTVDRWRSHGYSLRKIVSGVAINEGETFVDITEQWNGADLYDLSQSVKTGRGWFTFRTGSGPDAGSARRVPLTEFLKLTRSQHPREAADAYLREKRLRERLA